MVLEREIAQMLRIITLISKLEFDAHLRYKCAYLNQTRKNTEIEKLEQTWENPYGKEASQFHSNNQATPYSIKFSTIIF